MQVDIRTVPDEVRRWLNQTLMQATPSEDVVFVDGCHLLRRFEVATSVNAETDLKTAVKPNLETFNFDLARMERMLDTEFVEVPHFDNNDELIAWIESGE